MRSSTTAPGFMLIVEKFPWGNTLDVTRGVEAALEAMKPGLPGVEIDTTIFRPATFIEDSIDNLHAPCSSGCVLVVVHHRRLPLRVADGAHQHRGHPAVAAGAPDSCSIMSGALRSTRWSWRAS